MNSADAPSCPPKQRTTRRRNARRRPRSRVPPPPRQLRPPAHPPARHARAAPALRGRADSRPVRARRLEGAGLRGARGGPGGARAGARGASRFRGGGDREGAAREGRGRTGVADRPEGGAAPEGPLARIPGERDDVWDAGAVEARGGAPHGAGDGRRRHAGLGRPPRQGAGHRRPYHDLRQPRDPRLLHALPHAPPQAPAQAARHPLRGPHRPHHRAPRPLALGVLGLAGGADGRQGCPGQARAGVVPGREGVPGGALDRRVDGDEGSDGARGGEEDRGVLPAVPDPGGDRRDAQRRHVGSRSPAPIPPPPLPPRLGRSPGAPPAAPNLPRRPRLLPGPRHGLPRRLAPAHLLHLPRRAPPRGRRDAAGPRPRLVLPLPQRLADPRAVLLPGLLVPRVAPPPGAGGDARGTPRPLGGRRVAGAARVRARGGGRGVGRGVRGEVDGGGWGRGWGKEGERGGGGGEGRGGGAGRQGCVGMGQLVRGVHHGIGSCYGCAILLLGSR